MIDVERPDCYGVLEIVFPQAGSGLRESPDKCFDCPWKTECLKSAMLESAGLQMREEVVDRAYRSGMMSFFERWSKKKELHRKRTSKKRIKE